MSDLISRKEAIKFCYDLINAENPSDEHDHWNYSQERINQTEVILHHLEFMPLVQPDTTTHDSIHAKIGKNDVDKTTCDCISRQTAIDAICEDGTWLERQGRVDITMAERKQRDVDIISNLPSIQPKGTRLSTVCLLCKKPAVTFNTEDDIPYTNYSYCEDCLRKGLKLLREQKKNLQTQPERKTGRWLPDNTDYYRTKFICSVCGESEEVPTTGFGYGTMWDYCPNCGAKMEGGEQE